jgi:hypothetical protein
MDTTQYVKVKVKWPVVVKTSKRSMDAVTHDINPNGAFIRCARPLKLHEVCDIAIEAPNSDQPLKASVEVIWSNIYGPDDEISPRGMGVRFLNISSEDRQLIAKGVLQHLKPGEMKTQKLQGIQTLSIDPSETVQRQPDFNV